MKVQAFIVNSFADEFAHGNPAGVILYEGDLQNGDMQELAFDINKSETAYVRRTEVPDTYSIRWFSPVREVPLCGHATLAAAKVLYELTQAETIDFLYGGGSLRIRHDGARGFIMGFPLDDYEEIEPDPVYQVFFPGIRVQECIYGKRTKKVALRVDGAVDIRAIDPDFAAMKNSEGIFSNGIAITKLSKEYDFESRYFNPWYGVNEDPVTGSVHTLLARYWGRLLGKDSLRAYQASQRPGELSLRLCGDTVDIAGNAKIVIQGTIEI